MPDSRVLVRFAGRWWVVAEPVGGFAPLAGAEELADAAPDYELRRLASAMLPGVSPDAWTIRRVSNGQSRAWSATGAAVGSFITAWLAGELGNAGGAAAAGVMGGLTHGQDSSPNEMAFVADRLRELHRRLVELESGARLPRYRSLEARVALLVARVAGLEDPREREADEVGVPAICRLLVVDLVGRGSVDGLANERGATPPELLRELGELLGDEEVARDTMLVAVEEWEQAGLMRRRACANSPHGFAAVVPTDHFHAATDVFFHDWRPSDDARELASQLIASRGCSSETACRVLAWERRRLNAAAQALEEEGGATVGGLHPSYKGWMLATTPRTQLLANEGQPRHASGDTPD